VLRAEVSLAPLQEAKAERQSPRFALRVPPHQRLDDDNLNQGEFTLGGRRNSGHEGGRPSNEAAPRAAALRWVRRYIHRASSISAQPRVRHRPPAPPPATPPNWPNASSPSTAILEQARSQRRPLGCSTNMVPAYWLIGRGGRCRKLQGGEERAECGKQVIEKRLDSAHLQIRTRVFNAIAVEFPALPPVLNRVSHGRFSSRRERVCSEAKLSASLKEHRGFPRKATCRGAVPGAASPQLSWSHLSGLDASFRR
jgi:hypothetical protein